MRADPYTTDVSRTMRPAPHFPSPQRTASHTAAVRLLGENDARRTPPTESTLTYDPPQNGAHRFFPYGIDDPAEMPAPHSAMVAPHFALYTEVEGWGYDSFSYNNPNPAPLNRLVHAARKLILPVVLGLLAFGLFVIAAGPILARGESGNIKTGLNLSDYREHTVSNSVLQPEAPPIVDARTDHAPPPNAPQPAPSSHNNGTYDVVGAPSLSVAQIERVLKQYGSPAAGKGQALYDLGIRYGLDPAYALAFFVHESGCGTKGVARFTQSLGNIRWTAGFDNYEGYRKYPSWEAGMEDWYKLITKLYIGEWNLRTVDKIIPVYAPWGDNNNPPAYIRSVKAMVDSWRGK